jgi:hypothetical protein
MLLKSERREKQQPSLSRRPVLGKRPNVNLEREFQSELNNSAATLILDLAEVVERVVCKAEPASRITNAGSVRAITRRNRDPAIADGVQRQEDVASKRSGVSDVKLCRVRLIEYVEQSGPELNLLLFSDVEILEEGDVEIASTRTANVERRLRWSGVRERRNRQLRDIEDLVSKSRAAHCRVAEIDWRNRTETRAGVNSIECIGAVPTNRLTALRDVAGES